MFALPSNVTFSDPVGVFVYVNSVSDVLLPFLLVMIFVGFFVKLFQSNNEVVNCLFGASFVTTVVALLLWAMGVLSGFVAIIVGLVLAVSAGLLYWIPRE